MYELKHRMTQFGENILNIYQAERANSGEDAQTVADSYANDILPVIRLLQPDSVANIDLDVKNLDNPTDFHVQSLSSAAGLRSGLELASFNAAEIRFPRLRTDMRNGFKRFVGLLETDVANQDIQAPALALIQDIADAIVADWTSSIDSHVVAHYVIIKRVCTVIVPEGDPCPSYRLPETDGELVFYQPIEGAALTSTRTQVSRRVSASP